MSRVLKLAVLCCCIAGLMSATAMAQPRMFPVPLGGNPADYSSGSTVIFADPSDQVCVGLYVQGGIDITGLNVQFLTFNNTPGGGAPASGQVAADCSTIAIDTGAGDYVGFGTTTTANFECAASPYKAGFVLFNIDGTAQSIPANPDGSYFGELCFDVSADACGDFEFGYFGTPDTETIIADASGQAILNAVFDTLIISVRPGNDACADAVAVASGAGVPVVTPYDLACATDSGITGSCDLTGDVWYEITVECDGELTISDTSGAANIAVYPEGTACDPAADSDLGCGAIQLGDCDDQVGNPLVSSGDTFLVRIGGAVDDAGTFEVACNTCCTPGLAAGSATTIAECGASTDPCLLPYCSDDVGLGLGCIEVSTDPNDAGNTTDGDPCDDGLFCTVDDACIDGACDASNPNVSCVDENPCTVDACCEEAGDIIWSNSVGDVTCDAADSCQNVDINDIPCADLGDCPAGSTACTDGFCNCVANPALCLEVSTLVDNCVDLDVDGNVVVEVVKGSGTQAICAAQFFLEYDTTTLDFLSITPGGGVFNTVLVEFVDEAAGTIDYVVGENPGAICTGVKDEAIVATIVFAPIAECKGEGLCFRPHNPPTRLGDADGGEVCPLGHVRPDGTCGLADNPDAEPCCTGSISVDETAPVVANCPDNFFGNADCGEVTVSVTWPPLSASDNCDGALPLTCTISHNGGAPVDHLLMGGGDFPPGVTTIACDSVVDSCGNNAGDCTFSVSNSGLNGLHVDVELSPTMDAGPLNRCIEFELSDCGDIANPTTYVASADVEFGFPFHIPGHGEAQAKVPPGNYLCVEARDPLHTLNATCDVSCEYIEGKGSVWFASFKGSKDLSDVCHWLVNGNLNGLDDDGVGRIDILDYVTYLACVANDPTPGADTVCGTAGPHCDLNGDGIVSLLDFSFILINIFQTDKVGCEAVCAPSARAGLEVGGARESITVRELADLGMGREARMADRDGNGVVNLTDMALYLQEGDSGSARDVRTKGTRSVRGLR